MRSLRSLLLAGIALPLTIAPLSLALAQGTPEELAALCQAGPDGQPPQLTPADRVKCAAFAVDQAQQQLQQVTADGGDVAAATAQLKAAQDELAAAQDAATKAAGAPPPPPDQATNPPADQQQATQTPGDQPPPGKKPRLKGPKPPQDAALPPPPADQTTPPPADQAATPPPPPADQGTTPPPPPGNQAGTPPPPPGDQAAVPPAPTGQPATTPPAAGAAEAAGSTVELQLQKQGDTAEINQLRKLRQKLRKENQEADANQPPAQNQQNQQQASQGQTPGANGPGPKPPMSGKPGPAGQPPQGGPPPGPVASLGGNVVQQLGDRVIIQLGGQVIVRQGEEEESDRLLFGARDVNVEEIPGGLTRTTIFREDGSQIITTRDQQGTIVERIRVDRKGRQFVMIDDSGYGHSGGPGKPGKPQGRPDFRRFDRDLPPVRIGIPQDQYVVETRRANRRQIEQALAAPPVEVPERVYSLDEVRYSQRLRQKVRRIDVDTITFDFGSAAINPNQFNSLATLAQALAASIAHDPSQVFLIEGHTDAVGSDYANLLLSDRRAETVAVALSSYFNVPPENLITQGYGEQFLKVNTQLPERENRRVTLRNITELVQAQQ